jgi:acetyl-CoA carboxylase biotin carboxyl carrier protein
MSDRIDVEQVREIIRLAEESGLAELEVESPSLKVRVRRAVPGAAGRAAPGAQALDMPAAVPASAGAAAGAAELASLNHLDPIVAPMVGTFYRAPSPDTPPFVNEGDFVDEGQVVCIIEAMKLFNEIRAGTAGKVRRIFAENGQLVRAHQPLLEIEPA